MEKPSAEKTQSSGPVQPTPEQDKINKEIGNVEFDIMGIEVVNRKKDYRELPR